ncbi:MAG: DHH family phosphoesterase [Pyrinomonadaceae bacterium]|nr:DHH family phosphoesterase [Pyrinomonadaceae bacterium]
MVTAKVAGAQKEKQDKRIEGAKPEVESDFNERIEAARKEFASFIGAREAGESIVILHDSDADGVTAGVVLQLSLQRKGFAQVARIVPDRQRNAWTMENRARVRAHEPASLFVLDLGCASEPVIENVPTCFIDHHRPEGVPPEGLLISGYKWQPIPNTSLLVYELCRAVADVNDLEWIAAIGTFSDLGERAPFEIVDRAKRRYTAKWLKEATTLVNASRRSSLYDPEAAARALLAHDSPRSLVESDTKDVEALRRAREEVKSAMNEAKRAAPVFSNNVALIRINTRCQIHPLIAQIWRTRLPKYIVIAANEGYLPGRVNFSARSGTDVNVLEFLRSIEIDAGEGNYGHGHDQASGGSLPVDSWNELLVKLEFPKARECDSEIAKREG